MAKSGPSTTSGEEDGSPEGGDGEFPQLYAKDEDGNFVPVAIEAVDPEEVADGARVGVFMEAHRRQFHSGPLPSVEEFRAYGEVVASAPERILCMAENAQKAQHELINKQIDKTARAVSQGQWMGFLLMLFALGGAIYLASAGHPAIAALLAGPSVLVPIMRFYFHGKHEINKGQADPTA